MFHKNLIIVLLLFLVCLAVIFSLTKLPKEKSPPTTIMPSPPKEMPSVPTADAPPLDTAPSTTPTTLEESIPENIPLSDLQISACQEAHAGNTCQTKLKELGLVSPEDCCQHLKKCC